MVDSEGNVGGTGAVGRCTCRCGRVLRCVLALGRGGAVCVVSWLEES